MSGAIAGAADAGGAIASGRGAGAEAGAEAGGEAGEVAAGDTAEEAGEGAGGGHGKSVEEAGSSRISQRLCGLVSLQGILSKCIPQIGSISL